MPHEYPQRPVDNGPPPLAWSHYVSKLADEYRALLSRKPAEDEMQRFFERNPALVPGAFPNSIGHGAFPEALISQPPLSGIGNRRPDFMWLARNSAMVQPVLIEIESPGKRWIAGHERDRRQSADFTQALNQLRQWEQWLDKPANAEVLATSYGIPAEWRRNRAFRPQYWLIYGRRDEHPEEIARLRDYYGQKGLNVHAYDNLRGPNEWCKNYITVRARGDGTYDALFVPATASWTAASPESWCVVRRRREAVLASAGISEERKSHLIEQIPAWDEWATYWLKRHDRGG